MSEGLFHAGRNIALKVPPAQYDATLRFYRDVIGLKPIAQLAPHAVFEFGAMRLWVDEVATLSQAELWLEVQTPDTAKAAAHLASHGVTRCDQIEPLPPEVDGFWIASPCSIVHLVAADEQS